MRASIIRTLVITLTLTVVGGMAISVRNAYGQSSGGGMACCGSTNTANTGNTLNCASGYHQSGNTCVANQ